MAGSRKTHALHVLADHGVIVRGTLIEVVPDAPPTDVDDRDSRAYRAHVGDIAAGPGTVVWDLDGQPYTLTLLTHWLRDEYGISFARARASHRRRVAAQSESLWEVAGRFPH